MRIWVDVFDSDYARLGNGPVTSIKTASTTKNLDGAGTFQITAVGTDAQALALFTNENRVRIYGETLRGESRLLGEGIIRVRQLSEQSGSVTLSVSGPDALDELKRVNVLLSKRYQDTVQNIVDDLIGLVSGWTVELDSNIADDEIEVRYDGVSVLAALQAISDRYGYHLRLSSEATRTIQIGEFGINNGLRISKVEIVTSETILNDELLMVQNINEGQNTEQMYNWLLPIGAGEGIGALTLQYSTRTSPYTIQSLETDDGNTFYFISDSDSISQYGEIQRVGQFKQITPLNNSESGIIQAANALYDAAVKDLQRHKEPTTDYNITVKNVQQTLQAGDKISVDYKAQIETDGGIVDYISILDDFWVLSVTEVVNASGTSCNLKISNVDQRNETAVEVVMNAIEQITLKNLQPMVTGSIRSYVYDREIDNVNSAQIPIEFTDATLYLQRARLRLKTTPFRSTSQQTAAGGSHSHSVTIPSHTHDITIPNHQHLMYEDAGGYPLGNYVSNRWLARGNEDTEYGSTYEVIFDVGSDISGNIYYDQIYTYAAGGGSTESTSSGGGTTQTSSVDGTHTHPITYGIVNDTNYPQEIMVSIDGVDKTAELFGSPTIAPSNAEIDILADSAVLTALLQNASGGLRQEHEVLIECSSGQGRVEATIEIYEMLQTIAVI